MSKKRRVHNRRLLTASAVVSSLLLGVVLSAGVSFGEEAGSAEISDYPARQAKVVEALGGDSDAYDVASMAIPVASKVDLSGDSSGRTATLPDSLAELALPEGSGPYLVDEGECTIEYETNESASESLSRVSESMESAGWHGTDLGGLVGITFTKESGSIRWALVTCTEKSTTPHGFGSEAGSCVLVRVMNYG